MAEKRPRFDPYGVLQALDRHRVKYVVDRRLRARPPRNRGDHARHRHRPLDPSRQPEPARQGSARDSRQAGRRSASSSPSSPASLEQPVLELATDFGELKIVPTPTGTRGYDDLRRAARREPLGRGVRPEVASIGDLARMSTALGTERDLALVRQLRRLTALERGRSRRSSADRRYGNIRS